MNAINIFNPAQTTPDLIANVQNLAMLLSNGDQRKAHDYVLLYSAFGHHFNYDMGRTITQGYVLKGKPTLNADAMAGICRKSGLVRFIRVVEWTHETCTMEMARTDEPAEISHFYTFNMGMAQQQGLTRQQNWSRMPMQMLRARCLTMGLRATFPDCCSGIYSVDEIADNTQMSDHERSMITAQSMGEDINLSSRPQTQRPPQPSRQPQPQRAPQPTPAPQPQPEISIEDQSISVKPQSDRIPPVTHCSRPTPLNGFETIENLKDTCLFNKIDLHEANECNLRLGKRLDHMNEDDRIEYFYKWLLSTTLRNSTLTDDGWWRDRSNHRHIFAQLREEFPILERISDTDIGKSLGRRDFWEAVKVTVHMSDAQLKVAYNSIESLTRTQEPAGTTVTADYLASL